MNFKDYRYRANVRAAVITEDEMMLMEHSGVSTKLESFVKGDYAQIDEGVLRGWKKADFEAAFEPKRAERQNKTLKRKKAKAAGAETGS